MKWKEIVVYVHGITPEEVVSDHTATYLGFHSVVNQELIKLEKPLLGTPVTVEWGWEGSTGQDKDLAEAERRVSAAVFEAYRKAGDFTVNPARWIAKKTRPLFLYGISDMFYYVSEDGKKTVRRTVFDKVLAALSKFSEARDSDEDGISVTCIGHSAGTVILHDLLYNIFTGQYTQKKLPPAFGYLKKSLLVEARSLAKAGKLRLRKFYTFGSPITPMTFRSNHLIAQVVQAPRQKKNFLDLKDIGIAACAELSRPRWVNFWDPDDVISYPLEFLYENKAKLIEDKCIDISDNPLDAHGKYWTDRRVAQYIARTY